MGMLFVESIKRLYLDNKIDKSKIVELFVSGKITDEDRIYILGSDDDVE